MMETDLRSNFLNFFSLVNSTKHFEQHSGRKVYFTKLSSVKREVSYNVDILDKDYSFTWKDPL